MIPVDQTVFHTETTKGNCLVACLASILEVPISAVPFDGSDRWFDTYSGCLLKHGYELGIQWDDEGDPPQGYSIMCGWSPRGNFGHAVVALDGVMVHDPHPDRTGLRGDPEYWFTITPREATA